MTVRAFVNAYRFAPARGRALDLLGEAAGVHRESARLWRWRLPWKQRDSTYRRRILAVFLFAPGTRRGA